MDRQLSKKPFPYVLQEDVGEPKEKQVTFWLIPLKAQEAGDLASVYAGVTKEKKGVTTVNSIRFWQSQQEAWLMAVAKIDNYPPSEDFPPVWEKLLDTEIEGVKRIKTTKDPDVLRAIYDDLLVDQSEEIFSARADAATLIRSEKKR